MSVVYGSYASEYREIKGEIWETGVWVDLEDLTAKLNELCAPFFAGEIPTMSCDGSFSLSGRGKPHKT